MVIYLDDHRKQIRMRRYAWTMPVLVVLVTLVLLRLIMGA
jgi:hypothetical protein